MPPSPQPLLWTSLDVVLLLPGTGHGYGYFSTQGRDTSRLFWSRGTSRRQDISRASFLAGAGVSGGCPFLAMPVQHRGSRFSKKLRLSEHRRVTSTHASKGATPETGQVKNGPIADFAHNVTISSLTKRASGARSYGLDVLQTTETQTFISALEK